MPSHERTTKSAVDELKSAWKDFSAGVELAAEAMVVELNLLLGAREVNFDMIDMIDAVLHPLQIIFSLNH